MEIKVDRKWKKEDYTVGRMYINGEFICNTMEDTDRGLDDGMETTQIKAKKIPTRTAIPTGKYKVTLNVTSPKFSKKEYYWNFCKGKVPRLLNVKGFEGILIHCGATATNSAGCILVGDNTVKGRLTNSQARFEQVYAMLKEAQGNNEEITIEIY